MLTTRQSDIKALVDISEGRAPNLASAGTFDDETLQSDQALMLASVNNLQAWNDPKMPSFQASLLQHIVDGKIMLSATEESIQMTIQANAKNIASGKRLAQITQGLIAMGQVNAESLDPVQTAVVNSAAVSQEDEQVTATATVPLTMLKETLISKGMLTLDGDAPWVI